MFDKADYLAAYRHQVAERARWEQRAQDESIPAYQRERAQVNSIDIQREINELYSALLANGVSHDEIRG